ncbi:hypothetical protein BHE74_00011396 [Ensete ventricosum]|nr:hypothetical protein BHE74_00011396 [Ensete ventricosum]
MQSTYSKQCTKAKSNTQKNYLLDDKGSGGASDDVDEVEIAIADFLNGEALQLFAQPGAESRRGLDVLHQGCLVQSSKPIVSRRRRRRRRRRRHGRETSRRFAPLDSIPLLCYKPNSKTLEEAISMAAVQDLDHPLATDAPPSAASLPPSGRTRRSVHRALGGGAAGYSILSVLANAILLLVLILFFWAKSALLLNRFTVDILFVPKSSWDDFLAKLCKFLQTLRPLPPRPNLEISDEVVGKAADRARVWINQVLAIGHDITIRRDRKVFLQVLLLHFIRCSRLGSNVACLTCLYALFHLKGHFGSVVHRLHWETVQLPYPCLHRLVSQNLFRYRGGWFR